MWAAYNALTHYSTHVSEDVEWEQEDKDGNTVVTTAHARHHSPARVPHVQMKRQSGSPSRVRLEHLVRHVAGGGMTGGISGFTKSRASGTNNVADSLSVTLEKGGQYDR